MLRRGPNVVLPHISQYISQGMINVLQKYEKVGIMWHCKDCRSGEGRPVGIANYIDKIHEKIQRVLADRPENNKSNGSRGGANKEGADDDSKRN